MPVYLQIYCCLPEQHLQPQGRRGRERIPRWDSFVNPTAVLVNAPWKKQKSQKAAAPRKYKGGPGSVSH